MLTLKYKINFFASVGQSYLPGLCRLFWCKQIESYNCSVYSDLDLSGELEIMLNPVRNQTNLDIFDLFAYCV